MDLDKIWDRPMGGSVPWISTITDEAQADLHKIADLIRTNGREPNWQVVANEFEKSYPGQMPKTVGTLKETVRRLVKQA